jgi:hypothetical protein
MTVIDQLRAWTMRVPALSADELHFDVVTLAQMAGMRSTGAELTRLEAYRSELALSPVLGGGRLADPAHSGDLEAMARRAVDWLTGHAPAGRRFEMTDALYCKEGT